MKKKGFKLKGFTLIEIMAVMIILAVIALIAVPAINRSIKNSREKTYTLQVERIIEQVKKYGEDNSDELPDVDRDIAYVSLEELKKQGYITNDDVKDPRTYKTMNGCTIITYDASTNQYNYEYTENDCASEKSGKYAPKLTVTGIDNVEKLTDTVEVNTTYLFPTVSATSYNGTKLEVEGPTIKKKGTDVALKTLDTSTLDMQYEVTYTTYDSKKDTEASITITVTVIDTTPPVITVNGKTSDFTITHECGTTFTVPTASATDNSKLTPTLTNSSTVNPNKLGTYKVTYTATDSKKNVKVLIVTVKVIDTTKPVITGVSGNPSSWSTTSTITLTVSATDAGGLHTSAYSCNNGSSWQTSNKCTVTPSSSTIIKVRDSSGNISDSKSYKVESKTQYGYQTVASWSSNYSTSIPSDGYYTSKTQYGYQNVYYSATTNVHTDSNQGSYSPWYKNVYKYNYKSGTKSYYQNFSISDTGAGAGTVWSKSVSGWYITSITTDIDVANRNGWSNYAQPKVDFNCNGNTIYTMPASSDIQTNGHWSGNYYCNGTISIYSYGDTGSGRNWTGSGGTNYIDYYTITNTTSNWVFSSSDLSNNYGVNYTAQSGYVTPSGYSSSTGWRDNTAYGASQSIKPVTRTVYAGPTSWNAATGWRDGTAYTKTTNTKPVTRTVYRFIES